MQATLEDAIRDMTGETVFVRAAGRTDAGVHADGQVASFDLAPNIPPHGLLRGLNTILPADLAIVDVGRGGARFRRPLLGARQDLPLHGLEPLRALAAAGAHARGTCASRSTPTPSGAPPRRWWASTTSARSAPRTATADDEPDRAPPGRRAAGAALTFDIEATAFLKNMVRIVVGTLVDVGRGRIGEDALARMLATGDRSAGGMTAPPQGLTLLRVIY